MDNFTPLIVIPVVLVILFLFRRRRAGLNSFTLKQDDDASAPGKYMPYEDAKIAVDQLEAIGYYKYADAKDINELKNDLIESFSYGFGLSWTDHDSLPISKDYRTYYLDGEMLFKKGGFANSLNEMKPLFDKIGLRMDIIDHVEERDVSGSLNHSITINGKRYIVFMHFDGPGWGEAAQRYAEIINDQLTLQGKDERLYLKDRDENGEAVFLTEPQFTLIDNLLNDKQTKPLKVQDWCKVFGVDPVSYLGKKR